MYSVRDLIACMLLQLVVMCSLALFSVVEYHMYIPFLVRIYMPFNGFHICVFKIFVSMLHKVGDSYVQAAISSEMMYNIVAVM